MLQRKKINWHKEEFKYVQEGHFLFTPTGIAQDTSDRNSTQNNQLITCREESLYLLEAKILCSMQAFHKEQPEIKTLENIYVLVTT